MSKLIVQDSELVATATDFHRRCGGVTLVFPNGHATRVSYEPATSEQHGVLLDPDPTNGSWSVSNGDSQICWQDHSFLVGPPNTREGLHLQVTAEPADLFSVTYTFWQRFRADFPFAALPTMFFQIVEGRTRGSNDGETILPSGGKSLFVACCLMQDWVAGKADYFRKSNNSLQHLPQQMKDPLNEIAELFQELASPTGHLAAMRRLLGGQFDKRQEGLLDPS